MTARLLSLLIIAATSLLATAPTFADEAKLLNFARQSGQMAGGARFCRVDPEDIDEFISHAHARIAVLARDDYQKVLGKLEFKNLVTAFSAKKPEGGCEALILSFNNVMRGTN